MGILEDIESGIGLSRTLAPDVAPASTLADQYYGNDATGDAAQPLTSEAEQTAQANAYVAPLGASSTPHATAPGWTTLHIQQDLNALGASPQLAEDDTPGPKTTAAIVAFQKAHNLPATGVVDAATQNAMVLAMGIQVDIPPNAPPAPAAPVAPATPTPVTPSTPPAPTPAKPAPAPVAKKPLPMKALLGGGAALTVVGMLAAAARK